MKKKIPRIVSMLLVLAMFFSMAAVAFADTTMYVNVTPNVNFRKTPGGALICRIPYGAAVSRISTTTQNGESWSKCTYNNQTGYIMSKFLSSSNPNGSGGSSALGWVTMAVEHGDTNATMLYSAPSSNSSTLANLNNVSTVKVSFDTNDFKWARCQYNGMTGYIKYIDLNPTETQFLTASYGGTSVILQRGNKGQAVKNLQMQLAQLGYSTNGIDGIFGSGTEDAVISFQNKYKLDADGKAGPKTLKKMFEVLDYYYY